MSTSSAHRAGFTLVEVLVGVAVFAIVAVSGYQAYSTTMRAVSLSRLRGIAGALANEQFEIARNLPYSSVGIAGGLPAGVIPHVQTLTRSGATFTVTTSVQNIDDPFDGTIGGAPNDLAPADYKIIEAEIACDACSGFVPLVYTTHIAAQGLENTGNNGALFVRVFDAAGDPVADADVHVENDQSLPTITIDDTTNNGGVLQIVDTPPGVQAYQVRASKTGYSTDQTYTVGDVANPNPTKPHATVASGQVTQVSLVIDRTATLQVASQDNRCQAVPSLPFTLAGAKTIGAAPNVLKYSSSQVTDSNGSRTISGLEWDNYSVTVTSAGQVLAGLLPLAPLQLDPGTTRSLAIIARPAEPSALLVTVRDAAGAALADSTVQLTRAGYSATKLTGQSEVVQTSWTAGAGQALWSNQAGYWSDDGGVETSSPAGALTLRQISGLYATTTELVSSTIDLGGAGTLYQLDWQGSAPPAAGPESVRWQLASNNDQVTWDFIGPDGTAGTYYTAASTAVTGHSGSRYVRYKLFLQTSDQSVSPQVDEVSLTFTGPCVSLGQVFFGSLTPNDYTLTITRSGYQTSVVPVTIGASWQEQEVVLTL